MDKYGNDFGNNQTSQVKCALRSAVTNISETGGNSIRVWLFVEGQNIPHYDSNGLVVGTDAAGSLISDVLDFVQYAAQVNVFVNIALWNGALLRDARTKALFEDNTKLQSFFDNALTPLVKALANEPNVIWEVMNEPESSVKIEANAEPCFDTSTVSGSGAGWSGAGISMQNLLRFHSLHAAAIHAADEGALVTVGSWSEYPSTDATLEKGRKFFSTTIPMNACSRLLGARWAAHSILYRFTLPSNGKFDPGSPLSVSASAFNLSKPVIIGEFGTAKCSPACPVEAQYRHARSIICWYLGLVHARWRWPDDAATCMQEGISALKGEPSISVNIPSTPALIRAIAQMKPQVVQHTRALSRRAGENVQSRG